MTSGRNRMGGGRLRELRGVLLFAAGLCFAALVNFAYIALMGRRLPADEFATFGALLALLLMLTGPINAISGGTEMFAARRGGFPVARRRLLLAVGAGVVILTTFGGDTVRAVGWFGLATLLWVLLAWNRGALTGLGRFGFVGGTYAVEGTVRLGLGIGLVALGWGAAGAAAGIAIGMAVALLLTQRGAPRNEPEGRQSLGPDVWLAVMGLLAVQVTQVVDVVGVRLAGSPGSSSYVAASSLARAVMFAQLPAAAYALRRAAQIGAAKAFKTVAAMALVPAFALLVVMEVAPETVLRLTYGDRYADAANLLQLLAMAMFLGGAVMVMAYLQMGDGRTGWAWPGLAVGTAGTVALLITSSDPALTASLAVTVQALTFLAVGLPLGSVLVAGPPGRAYLFLNWRDSLHPQGGGSEAYVEHVARGLVEAGNSVTIFCSAHENAPAREERDGVRFIRRGTWRTVYFWAAAYHVTGRLGRHDVVVDVQNGVPFLSPLYCGRPVIVLVHHVHRTQWPMVFPPRAARFGWWIESRLSPWLYSGARYVAVSESTRHDLASLGVAAESITVVRNGGDGGEIAASKAAAPTVAALGRLVPHKRVEILLRATPALLEEFPGLRVEVLGHGPWDDRLRQEIDRLGIADFVELTGWVDEDEKRRRLAAAWVLAMPSAWEGWGLAVSEAAVQATPAVAFAVGGLTESVDDGVTGVLVHDEPEFGRAIAALLRDRPERERLGTLARERALELSWALTARAFGDVLEDSLEARRKRVPAPVAVPLVVDEA
ncbi:MAG TPA: glycosyltransferase [Actinomycetota bacterium]|nr:glycosyltransferase [Actinomycetota bacterium]